MRPATVLDGMKPPPSSELLGWRLIDVRPDEGWIRIGFEGRPEFRNPAGGIQGGFLAAMLDDTMGPAVFAMTEGRTYTSTIDMNVSYLAPGKVGPIFGEARVIRLGKTVGFLEAYLTDLEGEPIAHATSTVRLVSAEKVCG